MKPRKAEYGNKNICGANIERIRKALGMKQTTLVSKMQLMGVDIHPSSLSKPEGQTRSATDRKTLFCADSLGRFLHNDNYLCFWIALQNRFLFKITPLYIFYESRWETFRLKL